MSCNLEKIRFVNLTKSEEQELFCSICLCVFNDPLVTKCCRQTYCAKCIEPWLMAHNTCPNDRSELNATDLLPAPRVVLNIINQLSVSCDYREYGCNEVMVLEDLVKHVDKCDHNPIKVCDVCGVLSDTKSTHNCCDNLLLKIKFLEAKNEEMSAKYECLDSLYRTVNDENINLVYENQLNCQQIRRLTDLNEKATQQMSELKNKIMCVFQDNEKNIAETKNEQQIVVAVVPQLIRSPLELPVHSISLKLGKFGTNFVRQHSPYKFVRNKQFRILAEITFDANHAKCFGFYLLCEDSFNYSDDISNQWSIPVSVELRLIAQKAGCSDYRRKIRHIFTERDLSAGFKPFLSWYSMIRENRGYVKDEAVVLKASFSIDG